MFSRGALRRIFPTIVNREHLAVPSFPRDPITGDRIAGDHSRLCLMNFEDQFFIKGSFKNVKLLCLYRCDKNFVYHNLDKGKFPSLSTLVCLSHPADRTVQYRLKDVRVITPHTEYFSELSPNVWGVEDDVDLLKLMKQFGYT